MEAAKKRNDIDMISKLSGYEDLFAYDAKYHKDCYCAYIGSRNIKAAENKNIKNSVPLKNKSVLNEEVLSSSSSDSFTIPAENNSHNNMDNEIAILHRAAGILKNQIQGFDNHKRTFPTPNNINQKTFEEQVPEYLLKFVSWIIDDSSYDEVNKTTPKAIIPCNIIMALSDKEYKRNYFQIGLGIYLYHLVRSKEIINILAEVGFCCPYNDLRQLTTALAKQGISDNFVYLPPGIETVSDEKRNYIHASIDNFDLNEDTIDGKNTTHCMAMVVFQNHSTDQTFFYENIPREGAYSLGMEELHTFTQPILKYRKPVQRPEPAPLKNVILDRKTDDISKKINTAWRLLRNFEEDAKFPNWSQYNNIISENKIPVSDIFYLPFINNPPTEFDTIYTSMVRLVELADAINQNHIITADLAIYSKAQEILWNNPEPLKDKVTLMLGGMHLNMAFIASLGYIFSDGGLYTILTETDIYAENTCRMMLEGKQYSRAIRGLTLVGDALSRLFFQSLLNWCKSQENLTFLTPELNQNLQSLIQDFTNSTFCRNRFEEFLKLINSLDEIILNFVVSGSSISNTFKYWHSLLEGVDLMWRLLRSERNGDFSSHLCAVYDTLPYLAAAGRNLYLKWVPVYLSDMENLKVKVPYMFKYLSEGNFVVKKTSEKFFNCVASDMALEQSINKDCKSSAGIIGFSQKPTALHRWITTRHILGEYSKKFIGMYEYRKCVSK